jgi:hypothetical protein
MLSQSQVIGHLGSPFNSLQNVNPEKITFAIASFFCVICTYKLHRVEAVFLRIVRFRGYGVTAAYHALVTTDYGEVL